MRWVSGLGRRGQACVAALLYASAAMAFFALPILSRFTSAYVGRGGSDQNLFAWSLVWWPHAIINGRNPFHADVLWAPEGVNLAWVTGIPGPSLLMAPVTSVLGPVASLNLLLIASPVLAAWAAFLVCRRITGRLWPSVAGGYIFGFSTYVAAKTQGHVNLSLVFLVPLALYVVLRLLDGTLGRGPFVLLTTAILVGQFSISTEVFATMTVFGAIAVAGGFVFGSSTTRAELARAAPLILTAYVAAAIVVGPYLYHALIDVPSSPLRDTGKASADLLSFVVPGRVTALGGEAFRHITSDFTAPTRGDTGYLGPPLAFALASFAVAHRRRRHALGVLAFIGVAAIASLGPTLQVRGDPLIPLPWAAIESLPLLNNALPDRFTMYVWLGVSIAVALWLSGPGRWGGIRWGVVLLAAVAIAPAPHRMPPREAVVPPFFSQGLYDEHLQRGDRVLIIPWGKAGRAQDMLWQAATDMHFSLMGGHVGFVPPHYQSRVVLLLREGRPELIHPDALTGFLSHQGVDAVLVAAEHVGTWSGLLSTLDVLPVRLGGTVLYDLK